MPLPLCCKVITQPFIKSCSDLISKQLFKDFVDNGLHTYWTIISHVQSVFIFMNRHPITYPPILWLMEALDTTDIIRFQNRTLTLKLTQGEETHSTYLSMKEARAQVAEFKGSLKLLAKLIETRAQFSFTFLKPKGPNGLYFLLDPVARQ